MIKRYVTTVPTIGLALDPEGYAVSYEDHLAELEKLRAACAKGDDEVQQILGKAPGYPWYRDDQKNFPGATEKDGVCVGDNVAVSLAEQAAGQIALLKKKLELAQHEANGWRDSAAYFSRGSDYYRGLIARCGEAIGKEAFICDDGSVSQGVLNAKVPELVEAMCKPKNRFLRALRILFAGK